jgi:hypothetical protein
VAKNRVSANIPVDAAPRDAAAEKAAVKNVVNPNKYEKFANLFDGSPARRMRWLRRGLRWPAFRFYAQQRT